MAPKNRHMADACAAMRSQGFTKFETKAALKQLLEVYDNKWELILDSNYSVLVDVILENKNRREEKKVAQKGKRSSIRDSNNESDLVEPLAKRLCTRYQIKQAIAAVETSKSCQERTSKRVLIQNDSDSEESEEYCPPLVTKPRQRVSGNSLDPGGNCKKQPEASLNLICAGNSSNFGDYNADVSSMELLEPEPWIVDNQDSLSDSSQLLVPSSPQKGELELSLIDHSSLKSDLCVSNFDQDIEMVEQASMKSYEIQEYFSERGTHSTLEENSIFGDVPEFESSGAQDVFIIESAYHRNNSCALRSPSELFVFQNLLKIMSQIPKPIPFGHFDALQRLIGIPIKDIESICGETARRLKAFQSQKCLTFCKVEARFINHRCFDATFEVETPDRHYYHVALFTTRTVAAMEELTSDYGINLRDINHGGKAFQCLCGSPLCPDHKDMNLDVPLPAPLLTYIRRRRRA